MKILKICRSILILGLLPSLGVAQVYSTDITSGGVATNSPVEVGDTLELTFNVVNFGADPAASIPANDALVTFAFPIDATGAPEYYQYAYTVNPNGAFFNWNYDAVDNVLVGTNHTAIPYLGNENVVVKFLATDVTPNPTPYCGLDLQTATSPNDPSNNVFTPQPVIVPQSVTVSLDEVNFALSGSACKLDVFIKTQDESKIEKLYLEIRDAQDKLRNDLEVDISRATHSYQVSADLPDGKYIVRLRSLMQNGEIEYSQSQFTSVMCGSEGAVQLLQNPVKAGNIELRGVKEGDLVTVYDMLGKQVYAQKAYQDDLIKMQLSNLSAQMYVLIVKRDQFMIFEEKFINND